jgi:hypothetical protein
MHNRQGISPRLLWQCLTDYDLWPIYILGFTFQIPMVPFQQYLTLSLRDMGFDTFQTNLLAIPWTAFHIFTMLSLTYWAEVRQESTWTALVGQLWVLPLLLFFNVVDTGNLNRWARWAATTALLSYPDGTHAPYTSLTLSVANHSKFSLILSRAAQPIQASWASRNSNAVSTRTVSAAMYNMFLQAGGVLASNIYRADDAPRYVRGNRILLAVSLLNMALYSVTKWYYRWRNRSRERAWHKMSKTDKKAYLKQERELGIEGSGNKRLDFRFAH